MTNTANYLEIQTKLEMGKKEIKRDAWQNWWMGCDKE